MPFDPTRFDPKLVEQAEAPLTDSGDLQLPDDLLELAAQLGDDAAHLAKLYPWGHLPCGHHAPRDESILTDGSSTRPTAFPLAEREGHVYPARDRVTFATAQGSPQASIDENPSNGFLSATSELGARDNAAPPAAFHTHIRRTSRRLLRAVALVASIAAIAVGATLWYPREDNHSQPRNIAASPERSTTEVTHVANNNEATHRDPASLNQQSAISNQQSPPPAAPPPASRETFLHEYSGPELEGIYDLIGDSEDDKISI
jgi:hypothetical protein